MRIVDDFRVEPAFDLMWPEPLAVPFLYDAPHSGRAYPASFLARSRLDAATIRRSEDAHVDTLFEGAVAAGAAMMRARFPRAYLDVNREPLELDPRMFLGRLPVGANIRSIRARNGLGTVPRIVTERDEIYRGPIPVEEALDRITTVYEPYHATLRRALRRIRATFGLVVLIDCHSMPSFPAGRRESEIDVVLGDRNGTSCHPALTDVVSALLRAAGYRVARNRPYAGGYVTEHYGRPAEGVHALQIELSRTLYMDEATLEKTAGFARLAADVERLVRDLADGWRTIFDPVALAAE